MRRSPLLYWLTALALLLGQWSVLAHASEHTLESSHDGLCVVCVQGQSLEQMQLAASAEAFRSQLSYFRVDSGDTQAARHRPAKPNNRGPPSLL